MAIVTDPSILAQLNGNPVTDPAILEQLNASNSVGERFFRGMKEPIDAGVQDLLHSLPGGLVDSVNHATQYVNDLPGIGPATKALGITPLGKSEFDSQLSNQENDYQSQRQGQGFDWSRAAGNAIPQILATKNIPFATGLLKNVGIAGGIGGASSLLNPVYSNPQSDSDFWAAKGNQAKVGALTGAAVAPIASLAARVVSPAASTNPQVQTLVDEGVTPTVGQMWGGALKRIEDGATSIPFLGDMIKNAQRNSAQQLSTAAINRSLTPIGDQLPANTTGREAIGYATEKLGNAYDQVLTKIGAVKPDAQFTNDLSNLSGLVKNAPKEISDQFDRIIQNEILGRIDKNGVMTSEGLKAAESNLGQLATGASRTGDYDKQMLGSAIKEAQSTLRGMLARLSPDNAAELQSINTGYANLLRSQKAASYVGNESGNFSPAQLQTAVKALDKSKNNRTFATGNALMQDLSESGKNVLGGSVPDSGTPFRHAVEVGVGGLVGHSALPEPIGAAALPAAAGIGLAALPYTQTGQKLATLLMAKRPEMAQGIASGIRSSIPAISPLGLPLFNALLNNRP
jgi:hypothetical protein